MQDVGRSKLIYFNELDRGNHFAAWQEPELFTTEIRDAFRSLRGRAPGKQQRHDVLTG